MKRRPSRIALVVVLTLAATFAAFTAGPAALASAPVAPASTSAASTPAPTPSTRAGTVSNRASQPVYSYAKAIRESVWVNTGLDGDGDGKPDRVAVDIVRPSEAAAQGLKVPVIMDASPYYSCCGRGNESQIKTYDAKGNIVQAPLFYDNYFVPRGYAVVLVDLAGTNRSDGCVDVGGPSDIGSAKAVVDWLNGRAHAYRTRTGTTAVIATWTNGVTGMIGKSWDATIANGVAATGVAGLKTIVPISGISSWYDYYFQQGAGLQDVGPDWLANDVESFAAQAHCAAAQQKIVAGSPSDGSWTSFWAARDYVTDASKVRASVFTTAGMQDLNVRGKNFGQWWNALAADGVQRKVWLSQTGHVDPFDYRRGAWVSTLHSWFDHYLLGVANGIEQQPVADIERTPDHWVTDAVWPDAAVVATPLSLSAGTKPGVGTLGATPAAKGSTASFTDDPSLWEEDWATSVDSSTSAKDSFTTGVLTKPLRLSGGSTVTVTATSSTTSAHLSAVLVDLGSQTIRNYLGAGEGIVTGTTRSCYGQSTTGDSACFLTTTADTETVDHQVFSRGWADLGQSAPLVPGTPYPIAISLASVDHVVPAGHRLALIVAGTDSGLIVPASTTPTVTLDLTRSGAELPLVGGLPSLATTTNAPTRSAPTTTNPATTPSRSLHPAPRLTHQLPAS